MTASRYHERIHELLAKESPVRAVPAGGEAVSVCLAYPNSYRVGMASLGFQVVRRILLGVGCIVERSFMPSPAEEREIQTGGSLVAWESLEPAARFDVLAFSVQFENDYLNLLRMLRLAGLPLSAAERHQGHPLVLAGGAAVTINPLPLAHILDAIVLGESERVLPHLAKALSDLKGDRSSLLHRLADIEGIYVPAVHGSPEGKRSRPVKLSAGDIALSDIVTPEAEFGDTVLIEIGRGCSMGCRFCWAGWACRPPRGHDVDGVLAAVDAMAPGLDRVGLIATSHFDHPRFMEIVRGLRERGKKITISALRVDKLNRELLDILVEGGTRSVAVAPEAGSEELRRTTGKRFSNEQVIEAARAVASAGLASVKLYYLVGLPGESEADLESIADLTSRIVEAVGSAVRVSLSVNIFIPKPGTPFGEEPLLSEQDLRRRLRLLRRRLGEIPRLEVSTMAPWEASLQTLLSRGGAEVGDLLIRGVNEGWSLKQLHDSTPEEMMTGSVFYR